MKKVILIFTLCFAFIYFGCSELESDLGTPKTKEIHPEGINVTSSPDFHGKLIRKLNWDMNSCQTCHGKHYDGGTVQKSCVGCHSFPGGPEACNTCHGSMSEAHRTAPPRDISGKVEHIYAGVGAHNSHLYESSLSHAVECKECHTIPANYKSVGHIDTLNSGKAEIVFGVLASKRVEGVDPNILPAYSYSDNSCSNVYCHGYFKNGNVNNKVKWTSKIKCGSCHGNEALENPLPGGTHPQVANCQQCHSKTVKIENNKYILNKNFHINGEINFN